MQLVVKSQVLAGGRGLGTFKNGLKGGVHIVKADQVEELAGTKSVFVIQECNWNFLAYFFSFSLALRLGFHIH